ncbi:MAG: hypothetical protein RIR79_2293 [Pseudomonadota bacterium]|jgi:poly(ADP-ribose) glycohydrolase ARH3
MEKVRSFLTIPTLDQYKGCLLGLAMGDALGAPYEGGKLERFLWRFIGRTRDGLPRWTDDTQMALDLAESILYVGCLDQDDLAGRFARSYHWSRGYGPGTARVLKYIRRGRSWGVASKLVYPKGSFGNGAAMRASVLALFFTDNLNELVNETRRAAEVTHCHRLGVEGAVLIAVAAHKLLNRATPLETIAAVERYCLSKPYQIRLQLVKKALLYGAMPTPPKVASHLGNGITAPASCVSALYIALRHLHSSFESMMNFVIACEGDVDTIGAMAGTLWGIYNGAHSLPPRPLEARDVIEAKAVQLATVNSTHPSMHRPVQSRIL